MRLEVEWDLKSIMPVCDKAKGRWQTFTVVGDSDSAIGTIFAKLIFLI
jgi:hypothetical protein